MRLLHYHRRGTTLVLVVVVMGMVAGLLTLLATYSALSYRARQADHTRLLARAIAESTAGYARAHLREWAQATPEKPMEIDVGALVPPHMSGRASIDFPIREGKHVCRVSSSAEWGPSGAARELVIPMSE